MSEDPPEDITQHHGWRASAEAATGWNGSRELYVHRPLQGAPCPPAILAKLQALRAAAADRASRQVPA